MQRIAKQDLHEEVIRAFLESAKQLDTSSKLKYYIDEERIDNHTLDPDNLFKIAAMASALKDRDLKYGISVTYNGWSLWCGSLQFPIASGDFSQAVAVQYSKDLSRLFIDLAYKRIGVTFHVIDISSENVMSHTTTPVPRAIAVAQFYIQSANKYKLVSTTLPYIKWRDGENEDGKLSNDSKILVSNIDSIDIIRIDIDDSAGEPFPESIDLLRSCDFPFEVGIDKKDVKTLAEIQPIHRQLRLDARN